MSLRPFGGLLGPLRSSGSFEALFEAPNLNSYVTRSVIAGPSEASVGHPKVTEAS